MYVGCGTAAAADGPLPIMDVIAAATVVAVTGYCVYEGVKTYNDATVLPREGTFAKGKDISLSKIKEKSTSKSITIAKTQTVPQKRDYCVYRLVDTSGIVQYVGRTNNEAKTRSRHKSNPFRHDLELEVIHRGLTYLESRGLEQIYISDYQTLNKSNPMNNQIAGVSERNKNYEKYMRAGHEYIKSVNSGE